MLGEGTSLRRRDESSPRGRVSVSTTGQRFSQGRAFAVALVEVLLSRGVVFQDRHVGVDDGRGALLDSFVPRQSPPGC